VTFAAPVRDFDFELLLRKKPIDCILPFLPFSCGFVMMPPFHTCRIAFAWSGTMFADRGFLIPYLGFLNMFALRFFSWLPELLRESADFCRWLYGFSIESRRSFRLRRISLTAPPGDDGFADLLRSCKRLKLPFFSRISSLASNCGIGLFLF